MTDAADGPKQVDAPDYHNRNHTAAQACGWTKNALRGEGSENINYPVQLL